MQALIVDLSSDFSPTTIENDWYCSVRQIKWKSYGFENGKLQQLLHAHHILVDKAHRALDDAKNLATLLCHDIPNHPAKDTYIDFLMSKNPMRKPDFRKMTRNTTLERLIRRVDNSGRRVHLKPR